MSDTKVEVHQSVVNAVQNARADSKVWSLFKTIRTIGVESFNAKLEEALEAYESLVVMANELDGGLRPTASEADSIGLRNPQGEIISYKRFLGGLTKIAKDAKQSDYDKAAKAMCD